MANEGSSLCGAHGNNNEAESQWKAGVPWFPVTLCSCPIAAVKSAFTHFATRIIFIGKMFLLLVVPVSNTVVLPLIFKSAVTRLIWKFNLDDEARSTPRALRARRVDSHT